MTTKIMEDRIALRGLVKQVYKAMGRAIADYGMLKDNDRILVAVSGGASSLCLLKLLFMRLRRIPIKFTVNACCLVSKFFEVDREGLRSFFKKSGIKYTFKEFNDSDSINSFWCSSQRRAIIYKVAQSFTCNTIALGSNLDDAAQTVLFNFLFAGEIKALEPKIELKEEKLTIIRPLCYTAESEIHDLLGKLALPALKYQSHYGTDPRKGLIQSVIEGLEQGCPQVRTNVSRALNKVREDYLL